LAVGSRGERSQNTTTPVGPGARLLLVRPKALEIKLATIEDVPALGPAALRKLRVLERMTTKREGPQLEDFR